MIFLYFIFDVVVFVCFFVASSTPLESELRSLAVIDLEPFGIEQIKGEQNKL